VQQVSGKSQVRLGTPLRCALIVKVQVAVHGLQRGGQVVGEIAKASHVT
jgi:hypothetical protein